MSRPPHLPSPVARLRVAEPAVWALCQRKGRPAVFDTCDIPGGTAIVGTDRPYLPDDGEGPLRRKKLKPFRIGRTTVTNAQFQIFVEETGYITEAERFGWSFVFWSDVSKDIPASYAVEGVEWWRRIDGATWRDITGPGTMEAVWHPDHPVVHVSHSDASAYAAWAGGRLPSEAEWEHAARGGLGHVTYPWGEEDPNDGDYFPCNIWQGDFPRKNTAADGWVTTAPAQSFEAMGMAFTIWSEMSAVDGGAPSASSLSKSRCVPGSRKWKDISFSKGGHSCAIGAIAFATG